MRIILHIKKIVVSSLILTANLTAIACYSPKANEGNDFEALALADSTVLQFVPSMQHAIKANQNTVYAASLPLAWQILREELNANKAIQTDNSSLALLDRTAPLVDALDASDYQQKVQRRGDNIRIQTQQKVKLTFTPSFEDLPKQLRFDSTAVAAFGTIADQNAAYPHQVDINVYRNDDHFAVQLNPMEQDHKIILYKVDRPFENFEEMYQVLEEETQQGAAESTQASQLWRYQFTDVDHLVIPKVAFDNQHNYPELTEQVFALQQRAYTIQELKQSVSFAMNQHGLSMETGVDLLVSMGIIPPDELPRPKMLLFDKPFYIILKKSNHAQPYFVMHIANSLLLEKEGEQP